MATLRISESNGVFTPSSNPMDVPKSDGHLAIKAPSGGCLICLQTAMNGQTSYWVKPETTLDLSAYPAGTTWSYDIYPYTDTSCPNSIKANAAHTITISSSI